MCATPDQELCACLWLVVTNINIGLSHIYILGKLYKETGNLVCS